MLLIEEEIKMSIQEVHHLIDSTMDLNISELKKLVSHPSVSHLTNEVYRCAEVLKNIMEDSEIETQIIETEGNPIVFGYLKSNEENALTLLFYGHYDVQPPGSLVLWDSHPYKPEIRNGRLYGRGTADNKGQLLTHILAVRSYLKIFKSVPINIKFVFEGEEEIGSSNLAKFAQNNAILFSADMVYTSDGAMGVSDMPQIIFGARGVMNFEMITETANTDNHSGNKGGVIENAAWKMINILGSMKDKEGHVLIDGFYDDVIPASESDLDLIDSLPYDSVELARVYGIKELKLDKIQFYNNLFFKPTLTINGIVGGYTDLGTKNIIPSRTTAKMEVRLAFDQDPENIFDKIEKHIYKIDSDIQLIRSESDMPPSRTSTNSIISKTIIKSVGKFFNNTPLVVPMIGGSLPDYIWTKILKMPSVIVPYGNADEANHAPNENMKLELFNKGIHISAQVIYDLGRNYKI